MYEVWTETTSVRSRVATFRDRDEAELYAITKKRNNKSIGVFVEWRERWQASDDPNPVMFRGV